MPNREFAKLVADVETLLAQISSLCVSHSLELRARDDHFILTANSNPTPFVVTNISAIDTSNRVFHATSTREREPKITTPISRKY
jgi:hypothetical protein